ncbi:hypothetical protein C1645_756837 [Glomus cerebriforme]|uniref:Uncharacterized protein n=1 Tax=Glomus cerebriforme TaxID=658196 RepID=A0A397TED9_9GLOM|nr:hypothetical protein C1645_756837 [Glomus cerebriforme]
MKCIYKIKQNSIKLNKKIKNVSIGQGSTCLLYNRKKYNEIILHLLVLCIIRLFLRLSKNYFHTSLLSFFFTLPSFPLYIVQIPGLIRPLGDSSFGRFSHKCPGYDSSFGRFVHAS